MTIENGSLTRAAPLRASTWSAEDWTVEAVLSTGAAVTRHDGRGEFLEVLDLNQKWPASIPLLDSHSRGSIDDRLGEVVDIRTVNGEVIGLVRLSRHNERAKRVAAELTDGATYAVSIGYSVSKWTESRTSGKRTLTASALILLEASLTTVPADSGAGLRSIPLTTENTQTRAEINSHIRSTAKTAGLDQAWIDAQIDAEATVDAVNAAALAAMQARSATAATVRSTHATIGTDHTDPLAIRAAMSDALAHRLAPGVVKLEGRAVEFRGHRALDMMGDLAVALGERINIRDQDALFERAAGAHSTSDFPLLLAAATNKALLANYEIAAPTYRKWAARRPFNDFNDHSFLRVGDFPAFQKINENGEVKYGSLSESAEKIRAREFGTGIAIGRRALINDDLSALSDFSSMIAVRAANDENALVYGVLAANAALRDGVALFHGTHGNLPTAAALDSAPIALAVAALRGQKSLDGLALNLSPAFLVVGPALEVKARQLLAAVNATKSADVNVWANFAELVVDANITGNEWYVFASPAQAPTIAYGYVAGSEGPQVRTEVDFDTRAVKVAAGLDFGTGAIDFRGAVKNAGA